MKLILRIDANKTIGFGHAVRVAALIDALPLTETIICGTVENSDHLFPSAYQIEAPADAKACVELLAALEPDIVVCDSPLLTPEYWRLAGESASFPVVAIDDFGGPVQADLVVNGTVLPAYHHYPALRAQAVALCGGRYALLRSCFSAQTWNDPEEQCLTVVAGSGERAAQWIRGLAASSLFANYRDALRLVVGWGFADLDLAMRLRSSGVAVDIGIDGNQLAARLARTTVLLATGGMIVYEALAMGVPTIVFPQEDNMVAEAAWFAGHGGIIDLAAEDGMSAECVANSVSQLWRDPQARRRLSTSAAALIDGRGSERVATHVNDLLARASK